MRLSQFILENTEEILQNWEDFARTLAPGKIMSIVELRDDAERMLRFVAEDIETAQSVQQQHDKSVGEGSPLPTGQESAAHDHGLARAIANFSLSELVSEFRALRASVTKLWLERNAPTYQNALQLVRLNEAIDQLIAESVVRFAARLERDSALLTASIGHDLSNPLSAVVVLANVLTRAPGLGEPERDAATRIERAAKRISGMVQELQDFTRTRLASDLSYTRSPAEVGDLCREVISELTAANAQSDIRFSESGDLTAEVDSRRFAQAISNIVGNAIQHGASTRPIIVSAAGEDDFVRIEVHNVGEPIPDEYLSEIFAPLKTRPRFGGDSDGHLGLGLYIARRIVEGHGGTISVSSSLQSGTSFVIRVPKVDPRRL